MKLDDAIHATAGLVYLSFLLCLTAFWPSVSLLFLLCAHVVMVALVNLAHIIPPGSALGAMLVSAYDTGAFHWSQSLSFHLSKEQNNWMNMIHLFVLLANLVGYLSITHNESPPTTILLGGERAFDHSRLGVVPTFAEPSHTPVQDLVSSHGGRVVQLAKRGYYYAEEYRGFFGMQSQTQCTPGSGWRCYAIGVRTFESVNQRESSGEAGWKDMSFYQPLPTPAYDVDVQVEVSTGAGPGNCSSMQPIYIQHVSGQGNVIGPYRPAMDFAWKDPPDKTVCPGGLIGCVPGQRQSLVNYTSSLRSWCSANRASHPEGMPPPGGGSAGVRAPHDP